MSKKQYDPFHVVGNRCSSFSFAYILFILLYLTLILYYLVLNYEIENVISVPFPFLASLAVGTPILFHSWVRPSGMGLFLQ